MGKERFYPQDKHPQDKHPQDYYPRDSIAALATPWGESALAVIRVSGSDSLDMLSVLFEAKKAHIEGDQSVLTQAKGHTIHYGVIKSPENGEVIDEVMVAVYKAPRSYTGENGAEIFTHGSPAIVKRLLTLFKGVGFRYAGPGEFTMRAFLNSKMDLTQAEAVNEIVRAKTDRARAIALSRLSGSIEKKIKSINKGIAQILAAVEVRIDYPEEDLEEDIVSDAEPGYWQEELEKIVATYGIGKIFQEGIAVVLAGRTNAGKSTLFNMLLREDRAIVSEIHGTTRDYLEGVVSMKGIPIKLYDTAGLRMFAKLDGESTGGEGVYRTDANIIETEGVKRTDRIMRNAHLILYLVDAAAGITDLDKEILIENKDRNRLISIWNKVDLSPRTCPRGFIPVSALEGNGIPELVEEIADRVFSGQSPVDSEEPVINSLRQKELLERAIKAIRDFRSGLVKNIPLDVLSVDLKEALDALGEITGAITSEDILNTIFSNFCVGK